VNPFDYVNSINSSKKNLMRDSENDELMEKGYTPFVVNRALSYHTDTLLYANEMNRLHDTPNKMQYEYLLHSVRTGKRFSKWAKNEDLEVLQMVARYYQCNLQRAKEYVDILPESTVTSIVEEIRNL